CRLLPKRRAKRQDCERGPGRPPFHMNIACSNCPAKYAVPDDKVRGRKVRITCKRCGAGIVVDGTKLVQSAEAAPVSARERHSTKVGGLEAPAGPAKSAPQAAAPPPAAPPHGVEDE